MATSNLKINLFSKLMKSLWRENVVQCECHLISSQSSDGISVLSIYNLNSVKKCKCFAKRVLNFKGKSWKLKNKMSA